MKHAKCLSILALSLLFLAIPSLSSASAQSHSIKLEGTQWEGLVQAIVGGTQQVIYVFDVGSKVSSHLFTIQRPPSSFVYNVMTGKNEPNMNVTPIASMTPLEVGNYQVRGKLIRVEFSGHSIDAVVDGNTMKGEITYNQSRKKNIGR